MKTVLIDCSPKKKLSASGFAASVTAPVLKGETVKARIRTAQDREAALEALTDADQAVFFMPLYVDGIPSHVLPFLKTLEARAKETGKKLNVYVFANNGFIEGRQNEPLMQCMEHFCTRAGFTWCGGLGVGGGVMMNVMRIMLLVDAAIMLLNLLFGGLHLAPVWNFLEQVLSVAVLGCGIITYWAAFVHRIGRGKAYGKRYTRVMLPSFVFIICADIFFTIISLFRGGIFRGWFARKQPTEP